MVGGEIETAAAWFRSNYVALILALCDGHGNDKSPSVFASHINRTYINVSST